MRQPIKSLASRVMIPLTRWYLRKERAYHYKGISVRVFPGVFHPGFFSSTLFLLRYLDRVDLKGKSVLELGCGTGLISIVTARNGAVVTATDMSHNAIENVAANTSNSGADVEIIHSDLFDKLGGRRFDWIVMNPPYYAKRVNSEQEMAWNCGEDFEYFRKAFESVKHHLNVNGNLLMVLTKGCDIENIFRIASEHGITFDRVDTKRVLFDGEDYLFRYSAS